MQTMVIRAASFIKNVFQSAHGQSVSQQQCSFGHIAIIVSHEKSAWAIAVVQRFIASLRDQMGYQNTPEIDILAAQGSAERVRQLVRSIQQRYESSKQYELIVTIGSWCSKEVRDVLDQVESPIPQVFCAVLDPAGLGIVDSLTHVGRNISGVTLVSPDYSLQLEKLKALCPSMKKVVLPFTPCCRDKAISVLIDRNKDLFAQACVQHDIILHVVEACSSRELRHNLSQSLQETNADMVCVLPEASMAANLEILTDVCTQQKVPLCAADLSSVYHGAAIGFGERGDTYGPYAASIVCDLLVNGRSLETVPVITLTHEPHMRFNVEALAAQGVDLSPQVHHLLSMSSIFADT